mgnify:CR=1 FL=1
MSHLRLHPVRLALACGLALVLLGAAVSVLPVQPSAAAQPAAGIADNHVVFLPLVQRPWPNVTGVYNTISTGLVNNCSLTPVLPGPVDVQVTQSNADLSMTFPAGTATGLFNVNTGAFAVKASEVSFSCPYGCDRVTAGTFDRQATPITFSARTEIFIYRMDGSVLCSFSFDQNGTRN